MYLRILGGILILICSYNIGSLPGRRLLKRIKILSEFKSDILKLNSKLVIEKVLLPEALMELGYMTHEPLKSLYGNLSGVLNRHEGHTLEEEWKSAALGSLLESSLDEEEILMISDFGKCLGGVDYELQSAMTCQVLRAVEDKISELLVLHREKSGLYKRLSIFGGMFVIIILI